MVVDCCGCGGCCFALLVWLRLFCFLCLRLSRLWLLVLFGVMFTFDLWLVVCGFDCV